MAIQILGHFDIDQDSDVWASLGAVDSCLYNLFDTLQKRTRIPQEHVLKFTNSFGWGDVEFLQEVFIRTGLTLQYTNAVLHGGLRIPTNTRVLVSNGRWYVLDAEFIGFEFNLSFYRRARLRRSILQSAC